MAAKALYTLIIKGERDTYELHRQPRIREERSLSLSFPQTRFTVALAVSDLTGYRAAYIEKNLLRGMPIDKPREIDLASGWGPVHCIVTRVQ